MRSSNWLVVLITYNLSVEIFSFFRQDGLVTRFLTTALGLWLSSEPFTHVPGALDLVLKTAESEKN
jgi:hypothetical protein